MKSFFTVEKLVENTIIIEHSKFICYIKNVEDEIDAKEFIQEIRKKHSMATHNCYAYIADNKGLVQKFSDDGEPQGTAGMPMLDVLKNKRIFKTVAVVTRYFGGIKLGTGGLTRAYSGSVIECLNKCKILDMQTAVFVDIKPDYEEYARLLKYIQNENISVISTTFDNVVSVKLAVKKEYLDKFSVSIADAFNGKLKISVSGEGYHAF